MLLPLFIAFASVALGTALALIPRRGARIVGPIRIVALVAALAVIVTHLLPEAVHELGSWAFVAFAAGMAFPWLMDLAGEVAGRGGSSRAPRTPLATLEVSYVGLVVHRFGDGLSMGAIAQASQTPKAALAVLLALAAHIVPVTTIMVLAFVGLRGPRTALFRAVGLGIATMAGVLVAGLALERGPKDISPWISALVAGLLLHVVLPIVPGLGKRAEAPAPEGAARQNPSASE
jgi:zinc transporter ZupT